MASVIRGNDNFDSAIGGSTAVGAVGTYALMRDTSSASNFTPGSTRAGSGLYYANTYQYGANWGSGTTSAAGTWRIMGHTGMYNNTLAVSGANTSASVFVRIS
jgi:hypothetical protein